MIPTSRIRHDRSNRWIRVLVAVSTMLVLTSSTLVATWASASAVAPPSAGCASTAAGGPSRIGRFSGIVHPQVLGAGSTAGCHAGAAAAEAPYAGGPPLLNHGGQVMSTQSTGDKVVVTPIFWEPAGFSMTASYKATITTYLNNLAADSGKLSNVFASTYQYSGSNGAINYRMQVGTPIDDTTALPTDGCTVQPDDTTNVYADSTGYSHCIDDDQVIAETRSLVSANSLPSDFGHLYVLLLPKHVESCFYSGATNTSANACTLNHQPSTAYCAYHSAATGTVYANMPFPAYTSGTGYSCTAEGLGGGIQSPNGDVDADVEISPMSHEMAEAITDPLGNAWYDSTGNENGDDCAYIYGTLSGAAGVHYNQIVNGAHYLTQEEFSNKDFVPATSGCIQVTPAVTPTVNVLSLSTGPAAGGTQLTITGAGFPGASSVHFGSTSATFDVLDASHIDATVPAGTGVVDVTVSTSAGTSTTTPMDQYTYTGTTPPTVTGVSPSSGTTSGGTSLTITGTTFTAGSTVSVGGQPATSVVVDSATQLTATTPAHAAGTADVLVTSTGGTSAAGDADHYTYNPPATPPTVTGVSPSSGTTSGGTSLTITGTGFVSGSTVLFGSSAGGAVSVVSATRITVTTPKHAKGTVDVRVTTPNGSSAKSAADHYAYLVRPKVTRISRTSGSHAGGTKVTITGTGFLKGSKVMFGKTAARRVVFVSSTKIVVTTPKHAKGTVHIEVTTPGGRSAAHRADRFRFR